MIDEAPQAHVGRPRPTTDSANAADAAAAATATSHAVIQIRFATTRLIRGTAPRSCGDVCSRGSVRVTVTRVAERLDDEKLAQLRAWAETLLGDGRADLRAAARGLLMLADEVDRLRRAGRTAFAEDIGSALAQRLGTEQGDAPQ